MLIEEDEIYSEEHSIHEEKAEITPVVGKEEKSLQAEDIKKDKKGKKKLFGKKTAAEVEPEESLKPVSLAELRSKKESE